MISWPPLQLIKLFKRYDYYSNKIVNELVKYKYNESEYTYFPRRARPNDRDTYKDIFYVEDFQQPIEVKFENTTMSVPNGYERYLTMDFGDYMKLPPKEKRVGNHPAFIDLNTPVKYYIDLAKKGNFDFLNN